MNIRNLPLLGSLFLSGLLTLGACGSSSSSGTGGTTGSVGGTSGSVGGQVGTGTGGAAGGHAGSLGGSTGTGAAGGASGACSNLPPCLTFASNCVPSGTCVSQSSPFSVTGQTTNSCYSNGVKESDVTSFDLASGSLTFSVAYSKGGTACVSYNYSASGIGGAGGSLNESVTVKNGAGATVATLTPNADGTATVVCTGGSSYVVTDTNCMPSTSADTTADCTDGVCQ